MRSTASGAMIAHSSTCIAPIEPPTTAATRSIPIAPANASCARTWSRIVRKGKRVPHSTPSGASDAGPVDPWHPPITFGATTKYRSVSIASPGPTTPGHQPALGWAGPAGPMTWLSPVSACSTSTTLSPRGERVPHVS